jgi:hypothetical protein
MEVCRKECEVKGSHDCDYEGHYLLECDIFRVEEKGSTLLQKADAHLQNYTVPLFKKLLIFVKPKHKMYLYIKF